jgi:hypothetical protein
VRTDSWRTIDSGISRGVPSCVLLPDGRVLLASGEDYNIDQVRYRHKDAARDPRYIQIFDPYSDQISTEKTREGEYRGYHNFAALLKDGRVLVGGGVNQNGDVGCENPTIRIFSPSYLSAGSRPIIIDVQQVGAVSTTSGAVQPLQVSPCERDVVIGFSGVASLHPSRGAALLAVQAFTHSYGENQRYIPLNFTFIGFKKNNSSGQGDYQISLMIPCEPLLIPGHYFLFLVSENGVPSVGFHTIVTRQDDESNEDKHTGSKALRSLHEIIIIIAICIGGILFIGFAARSLRHVLNTLTHERIKGDRARNQSMDRNLLRGSQHGIQVNNGNNESYYSSRESVEISEGN